MNINNAPGRMNCFVFHSEKVAKCFAKQMFLFSLLLTVFYMTGSASIAQSNSKAVDDKKLQDIFNSLKNADGYTYQIGLQSSIAGDTQKTPVQIRINYASRVAFIMYSKTDNELFFLCEKGQFKVDEDKKVVYFKLYSNDTILQQMKQYYSEQMALAMDSIFLSNAVIAQKKRIKNNVFYRLSYPAHAAIKDFNILARFSDGMPEKVQYTIEQSSNASPNSIQVRQQLTMDHYRHSMPDEVKSLVAATKDLNQFLQRKYSGYTLKEL